MTVQTLVKTTSRLLFDNAKDLPHAYLSNSGTRIAGLLSSFFRPKSCCPIHMVFRLDAEFPERGLKMGVGLAFELELFDGRIARQQHFGKQIARPWRHR